MNTEILYEEAEELSHEESSLSSPSSLMSSEEIAPVYECYTKLLAVRTDDYMKIPDFYKQEFTSIEVLEQKMTAYSLEQGFRVCLGNIRYDKNHRVTIREFECDISYTSGDD
jgi:hypothetical protein